MLLDLWYLVAALGFLALSYGAGRMGVHAGVRVLEQRIYSLECDVADLQTKLLVEIKKRAGLEGVKARKVDALESQVEEALTRQPEQPKPWWEQFVHPSIRGA